jgi:two-component system chemotaxis sensor kinase CheA
MSDMEAVARDDFFDDLLGDFLDESGQLLDRLNENLLQLDEWVRSLDENHNQRCDDELMNEMFRSAHSLKGLSAMLGLGDINNLTHKVENVFDAARKDQLIIDGDTVELMFQAVDRLVGLVDVLKEPDTQPVECEPVIESIAQLLQSAGVERQQTSQHDAENALQDELAEAAATQSPQETDETETPHQPAEVAQQPSQVPAVTERESQPEIDFFEGLTDESETPSKYLSIFIDETELSLDELTETLLALEGEGDSDTIEKLLVTSHRIKGSAASVGLNRPAKLAHLMEDLLQNMAGTRRVLTPELTDAMLKCTDALRKHLDGLKCGSSQPDQFNQMAHELLAAQVTEVPEQPTPQPATSDMDETTAPPQHSPKTTAGISEELRQQVKSLAADYEATLVGVVCFEPNLPLVGLKAQLLYEKLSNLGDVCFFDPPPEVLDDLEHLDSVSFGLTTEKPAESICSPLRIAGVQQMILDPLVHKKPAPPTPTQAAPVSQQAVPAPKPAAPAEKQQASKEPAPNAPASKEPTNAPSPQPTSGGKRSAPKAKARATDSSAKPTETLRVDIERLDQLMNLAGQLVINKARFSQIGDNLKSILANKQSSQLLDNTLRSLEKISDGGNHQSRQTDLQAEVDHLRSQARRIQNDLDTVRRDVQMLARVRSSVDDLFETIHQLDRVSDGIQQSVMGTRMVPIGPLLTRFKRVIRDITRANGKEINLVINGEKTELDKRMIDELGDPLIHMVRNCADHGIELPEQREAAGKPRQGTVTLDAFHRGNRIFIQVTDDGKGLDPNRIRSKALEKGLITEAEAEKMTPHQIYQLAWEPGLSTAEKVTQVSGRGMGMDIVKSKIDDLNGIVDLDSQPGKGTTLTIKLPVTLAILPSLMVEIDGDIIAMPLESVIEIVSIDAKDLHPVHGQLTARVRDRVISTVNLDKVFTWTEDSPNVSVSTSDGCKSEFTAKGETETSGPTTATTLVIIGEQGCEIALVVDRVLGEEDVVIKSMAENYRNVAGIAGASILGDGRVSLILDLAALVDMSSNKHPAAAIS